MISPAEHLGLPADWIVSYAPQGSEEWHALREGPCTGSRAKDARATVIVQRATKGRQSKKTGEWLEEPREEIRGPSDVQILYARDLARMREGGRKRDKFQTWEMKQGQLEEPAARAAYELATGCLVDEVGFICTADRKFGVSPDGLRFELNLAGKQVRGAVEIKTMLSSDTLFQALIFGDWSEYRDQILMLMWLLRLEWVDLVLWAPDLPEGSQMRVLRIERDEAAIQELEEDLIAFDRRVEENRALLRAWIAGEQHTAPAAAPAIPVTTATTAPEALPEDLFS
jgi:exodeoxyribonuclease (lambda-induced)